MADIYGKKNMIKNFFWKLAERFSTQGITILTTILLARILLPQEYGVIAICMIVVNVLNILIEGGFGQALIQKKDISEIDFNTVFVFNIILCCIAYFILFQISPFVETFFCIADLSKILRVLGVSLIIGSLRNVHQAYAIKNLLYKKMFKAALIATSISAIVSLYMAYHGFGVWTLVFQQLLNGIILTVILWFVIPWKPSVSISYNNLLSLFSYGSRLLASSMIDTTYRQIWQLVIGKAYSVSDLAYYNQGEKFPAMVINNINSSIDGVLFPALSNYQDDIAKVRDLMRRAMKTSICIIAPIQMILVFSSSNIVTLVLTEKWLPCVPFFSAFCITYMFTPLHTANLNAIKALGRSDIFLKLEICRKSIAVCILMIAMNFGIFYMLAGLLMGEICGQIVNSYPNKKLLGYGYKQQLRDILPSIFIAFLSGAIIYFFNFISLPLYFKLILQIFVGITTYCVVSYILKIESFMYLYQNIRKYIRKKGVYDESVEASN